MASEHYFSPSPTAKHREQTIEVELPAGRYEFLTDAGVFSPGHLDRGTETLLRAVPEFSDGQVLDLGCGWGPVAVQAALASPIAQVWAVDVNERARELTTLNAASLGLHRVRVCSPEQVPDEVEFSLILSNPPIRVGKAVLHDLLATWLPRLTPGGAAYLVVAKHLGAPSLLTWLRDTFPNMLVERWARDRGFHVLKVFNPV